jgi:hypothetical protein
VRLNLMRAAEPFCCVSYWFPKILLVFILRLSNSDKIHYHCG